MSSWRARAALLSSAAFFWACAYYNGLYNANHLAADASRANREGRPAEARSLWEQAAIKAESVAVRNPRSKYRDPARLLQGESLRDAGACSRAIDPLRQVSDSGTHAGERTRARLALGECLHRTGESAAARDALMPLLADSDPATQRAARLWHARASLAQGDARSALDDLETMSGLEVLFERSAALSLLGRADEAAALLASVNTRFDEVAWRSALEAMGRSNAELASGLTDQLVARADVSPGARARLLLADADRLALLGSASRSGDRLRQAAAAAPDSADGRFAAARAAVADLQTAESPEAVAAISGDLTRAVNDGGAAARFAEPVLAALRRVAAARESQQADLRMFLAAEGVRDALSAAPLATLLFLEVARDHPASPIAPKALLAAAQLDPTRSDSILAIVRDRYPESPYWLALNGAGPESFGPAEDSLRALATRDASVPETRPRPGVRPSPGDEEIRRPPVQPGRGVPEP